MPVSSSGSLRSRRYREKLRAAGFRRVEHWVPDTRRPEFMEEARRQCLLIATAEREEEADPDLELLNDLLGADLDQSEA